MPGPAFRIMNIVGARPNMMKAAPLLAEMRRYPEIDPVLVHTGQHYDYSMSQVFFDQLDMPAPDYNLEVGSGTHHSQTSEIIRRFGELVRKDRPDLVVVVGDVNSTIACALVAAKENIPVAHVEAGLRSFDRSMPEEINRLLTDAISDLLFTTEQSGDENLSKEGVSKERVFFVGNLMIDSLVSALPLARESGLRKKLGVQRGSYAVVTLHRPSNVDDPEQLARALKAIAALGERIPVLFPVHPRTAARMKELASIPSQNWGSSSPIGASGIWTIPPASYVDFLGLIESSMMVITDSGGIQEETTYLGVPCLTYRDNTERPVTVTHGTNRVVGANPENLLRHTNEILQQRPNATSANNTHKCPPLWDGKTAPRIVSTLHQYLRSRRQSHHGEVVS